MAGRRTNLAALALDQVEVVPGASEVTMAKLAPGQVAPTPLNPREHYGSKSELAELGESMRVRQLQPVVVVTRRAYLHLWPDHSEQIGEAEFVLANGERRYRAALQLELPVLHALIRDEVAASRAAFLDAVLSENLDRKNFDAIEEAHAVEAMVAECGTAASAADQFRRTTAWVSQRRALLRLTPELQRKVRTGELPVRIARKIASAPAAEQENAWQRAIEEQAEQRSPAPPAAASPPGSGTERGAEAGVTGAARGPGQHDVGDHKEFRFDAGLRTVSTIGRRAVEHASEDPKAAATFAAELRELAAEIEQSIDGGVASS